MLPDAAGFGRAMEQLGIGRDERIVVYDNSPLRTAARGWFMLRHFGAERVAILNGGLQKWSAEGRPTESGEPASRPARFGAAERAGEVVSQDDIRAGLGTALIDARGKARFEGSEPDPRPGVSAGHIPGARNLPAAVATRRPLPPELLEPGTEVIASCGSGITACVLLLALADAGRDDARLYAGSWSDWVARGLPVG